MEKRYQVFVSSTYSDLRDEREKVINELTRIGYIAAGMEQFPATPEEQMEFIKVIIDESDYYIIIVRGKYGSTTSDGISFTENEYNYAIETRKPVLAFLYSNITSLQISDTDNDPEKMAKLNLFRRRLEEKRIVKYWNNVDELVSAVKDSINDVVRRRPGIGWVRGDQVADPRVYKEIQDLKEENATLKEQLRLHSIVQGGLIFPDNISHGEDIKQVGFRDAETGEYFTVELSWDDIIFITHEEIHIGSTEKKAGIAIENYVKVKEKITNDIDISEVDIKDIRYQLEALGIIESKMMRDQYNNLAIHWVPTDKGKKYISIGRAEKRKQRT